MRLKFVKWNPGGNTTIIILDPLPRHLYPGTAARVIGPESLSAEQVGFLEEPTLPLSAARLQMMGGEFCGNAARSFAAWLVRAGHPGIIRGAEAGSWRVPLEISGCGEVLPIQVKTLAENSFHVEVPMPVPLRIEKLALDNDPGEYTLVAFAGITHVVAWNAAPSQDLFRLISAQVLRPCEEQPGEAVDALGVMFYDQEKNYLTPVVYVPQVGSLVWESSCGSGTVAVAAALAAQKGKSLTSFLLPQPGGTIGVNIDWAGKVKSAAIYGEVTLVAEGVVYL